MVETVLDRHNIAWMEACTWTTDAIYRETVARAEKRRQQGCAVVEMEAAALFAVANFRKVRLACLFYGGDTLAENVWDSRDWSKHPVRDILLDVAIEACAGLK